MCLSLPVYAILFLYVDSYMVSEKKILSLSLNCLLYLIFFCLVTLIKIYRTMTATNCIVLCLVLLHQIFYNYYVSYGFFCSCCY